MTAAFWGNDQTIGVQKETLDEGKAQKGSAQKDTAEIYGVGLVDLARSTMVLMAASASGVVVAER
jgi:hypothetical protein